MFKIVSDYNYSSLPTFYNVYPLLSSDIVIVLPMVSFVEIPATVRTVRTVSNMKRTALELSKYVCV